MATGEVSGAGDHIWECLLHYHAQAQPDSGSHSLHGHGHCAHQLLHSAVLECTAQALQLQRLALHAAGAPDNLLVLLHSTTLATNSVLVQAADSVSFRDDKVGLRPVCMPRHRLSRTTCGRCPMVGSG